MGIIIAVIIYEVLSIGGISWYLYKHEKAAEGDEFLSSGRKLTPMLAGIASGLALLGTVHIFGMMEMAWNVGAVAVWWGIATVLTLCVICLATGRWVRRTGCLTIPELINKLFGPKIRIAVSCIIAVQTFAIMTLETQGLGIIMHTLSGNTVSIQTGAIIGGIAGLCYVALAGMKEVAWVNVINIVVIYGGLILAVIFLGYAIPGGWNGVQEYYVENDVSYMTSLFGDTGMLWTFALGMVVASVFAQGISQMGLHSSLSAESEGAVRKSLWWASLVAGLFGIFSVGIGLAAKTLVAKGVIAVAPEIAAKTAGTTMLLEFLPPWLMAILVAGFLGAVLSTFAITCLSLAAIFTKDIYCNLHNSTASPATQTKVSRIVMLVAIVVAVASSASLPPIGEGAAWVMAWLCPIFWNVIFGLFWKRSRTAAGWTFAVTWIVLVLWSFTPLPVDLGIGHLPTSYASLAVTLVVGIILHLTLPGEPALFSKDAKESRNVAGPELAVHRK